MNYHTKDSLVAFESGIRQLWEDGELRMLIHLCGGNEDELIQIFNHVQEGDWVFSTHRNHYHALLAGIPAEQLEARIKAGGSMFVYSSAHNFACSAILAGNCAMAVGVALAIKANVDRGVHAKHVWCFVGDGAEEEGHFYEAVCYATGHNLPITFIVEDNDRQVDTDKRTRRGPGPGFFQSISGLPLSYLGHLGSHKVLHYQYRPTYPHAGSGCKHKIEFKR
jgi:TPP-dependent pyruvate/acetoin dehydrogenase alpha subunit